MSEQPTSSMLDLRGVLRVLRQRAWVIVACVVATTTIAVGHSYLTTPRYAATSAILIQSQQTNNVKLDSSVRTNLTPELTTEVEMQLIHSQDVRKEATDQLGYSAGVSTTAANKGVIVNIRAVSTDPQKAADIANAYAAAYVKVRQASAVDNYLATGTALQSKIDDVNKQIDDLDDQIKLAEISRADTGGLTAQRQALITQRSTLQASLDNVQVNAQLAQGGGPQIIATANVPAKPFDPNPERAATIGILAGLLLGIAAAFILDYFDDTIKTKGDLEAATGGVITLALIPRLTDWKDRSEPHVAALETPSAPIAEAYRSLRTSVQFAGLERPIRILQVTSPNSQDGKTTTITNLAVVLARAGQRVVLVDCDLRRPRVHEFFGLSNDVGFTSVLLGQVNIIDAIQPVPGQDRLRVLASGPTPPDPSELLSSHRSAALFEAIKDAADIVLIDSPPVLPVTDALVVSDLVDAVIMVTNAEWTGKKEAARAVELLRQVDATLIGSVLNGVSSAGSYGYSGYGYGYGYGSGKDVKHRRWGRRPPPRPTRANTSPAPPQSAAPSSLQPPKTTV